MTTAREAQLLLQMRDVEQQLHAAETLLTHLRTGALLAIDCRRHGDEAGERLQVDLILTALAGKDVVGFNPNVDPLQAAAEALSSMHTPANEYGVDCAGSWECDVTDAERREAAAERYERWLAEQSYDFVDADDEAAERRRESREWDRAEVSP